MSEAQSLNLRRRFGRGSRARTLLVLFSILGGLLLLVYLRIRTEIAPKYQPLVLAGAGALFLIFHFGMRNSRKKPRQTARLEISDAGVAFNNPDSRVTMPWSGFSQCLESPTVFVLLDRPQGMLIVLPKRAFPNAAAQDWFRARANEPSNITNSTAQVTPPPARTSSSNVITLNIQLGYRDYLVRTMTSWWSKSITLSVIIFVSGDSAYLAAFPPPDAVNSSFKSFVLVLVPSLVAMFAVILPLMSLFAWSVHRNI